MEKLLGMLRAAGDATRLRLLLLLTKAELTVSEITLILGQSQPRVSRHLRLLCEAGLLERFKEGAWVFYRAAEQAKAVELARAISALADIENDRVLIDDRDRLDSVLDAGTGTGRMLELLSPYIKRGIGIDVSVEMLAIARDRLGQAGAFNCQVRRGDVYRLPFADGQPGSGFDAVLFHQVLHFLDDPQTALREA